MSYNTIDRRHTYGICLDTETANIIENANGQLDVSNALFYDLGFQVIDSHGRTYGKELSFVNSDIFVHEEELMANATLQARFLSTRQTWQVARESLLPLRKSGRFCSV